MSRLKKFESKVEQKCSNEKQPRKKESVYSFKKCADCNFLFPDFRFFCKRDLPILILPILIFFLRTTIDCIFFTEKNFFKAKFNFHDKRHF